MVESNKIAITAYDGLTQGKDQTIPDSYIAKFAPIAKKRVVLAANRLAYAIDHLFSSKKVMLSQGEDFEMAQKMLTF